MAFERIASLFVAVSAIAQVPFYRADVSLVRVDAEVTDGTRALTGLAQADFQIFDNGGRQSIAQFAETEDPLDLILLFDISGSMKGILGKIASTAESTLTELRAGDRVAVMAFSTKSRYLVDFTPDFAAVARAISDQVLGDGGEELRKGEGGTAIVPALAEAVRRFHGPPEPGRRRAILIITDNLGFRYQREGPVTRAYWEADAVVTGIILTSRGIEAQRQYARFAPHRRLLSQGMTGIARNTGGDVLKGSDPAEALGESIRRLRRRYSLFFKPPEGAPGRLRTVKVELAPAAKQRYPTARVRARRGYVSPPAERR